MINQNSLTLAGMFEPSRYIQSNFYYCFLYGKMPCKEIFHNVKEELCLKKVMEAFGIPKEKILNVQHIDPYRKSNSIGTHWIEIKPGVVVFYSPGGYHSGGVEILFQPEEEELKNRLKEIIVSCVSSYKPRTRSLSLITENRGHLGLDEFKINPIKVDIATHYNDDFEKLNDLIIQRLNTKNDKGVLLLHGKPGTGKTTYLRYLCSKVRKRIIYITPQLAHNLASPSFISFLAEFANSVLIIEDAEEIISNHYGDRSAVLSNLLNLSDGLLSDCLKIQLVCTFNCRVENVDEALLRKGRLIARYNFDALEVHKVQNLFRKLKIEQEVKAPMTLAEIYHLKDESFTLPERKRIGFMAA
jgi:hypothetical protein